MEESKPQTMASAQLDVDIQEVMKNESFTEMSMNCNGVIRKIFIPVIKETQLGTPADQPATSTTSSNKQTLNGRKSDNPQIPLESKLRHIQPAVRPQTVQISKQKRGRGRPRKDTSKPQSEILSSCLLQAIEAKGGLDWSKTLSSSNQQVMLPNRSSAWPKKTSSNNQQSAEPAGTKIEPETPLRNILKNTPVHFGPPIVIQTGPQTVFHNNQNSQQPVVVQTRPQIVPVETRLQIAPIQNPMPVRVWRPSAVTENTRENPRSQIARLLLEEKRRIERDQTMNQEYGKLIPLPCYESCSDGTASSLMNCTFRNVKEEQSPLQIENVTCLSGTDQWTDPNDISSTQENNTGQQYLHTIPERPINIAPTVTNIMPSSSPEQSSAPVSCSTTQSLVPISHIATTQMVNPTAPVKSAKSDVAATGTDGAFLAIETLSGIQIVPISSSPSAVYNKPATTCTSNLNSNTQLATQASPVVASSNEILASGVRLPQDNQSILSNPSLLKTNQIMAPNSVLPWSNQTLGSNSLLPQGNQIIRSEKLQSQPVFGANQSLASFNVPSQPSQINVTSSNVPAHGKQIFGSPSVFQPQYIITPSNVLMQANQIVASNNTLQQGNQSMLSNNIPQEPSQLIGANGIFQQRNQIVISNNVIQGNQVLTSSNVLPQVNQTIGTSNVLQQGNQIVISNNVLQGNQTATPHNVLPQVIQKIGSNNALQQFNQATGFSNVVQSNQVIGSQNILPQVNQMIGNVPTQTNQVIGNVLPQINQIMGNVLPQPNQIIGNVLPQSNQIVVPAGNLLPSQLQTQVVGVNTTNNVQCNLLTGTGHAQTGPIGWPTQVKTGTNGGALGFTSNSVSSTNYYSGVSQPVLLTSTVQQGTIASQAPQQSVPMVQLVQSPASMNQMISEVKPKHPVHTNTTDDRNTKSDSPSFGRQPKLFQGHDQRQTVSQCETVQNLTTDGDGPVSDDAPVKIPVDGKNVNVSPKKITTLRKAIAYVGRKHKKVKRAQGDTGGSRKKVRGKTTGDTTGFRKGKPLNITGKPHGNCPSDVLCLPDGQLANIICDLTLYGGKHLVTKTASGTNFFVLKAEANYVDTSKSNARNNQNISSGNKIEVIQPDKDIQEKSPQDVARSSSVNNITNIEVVLQQSPMKSSGGLPQVSKMVKPSPVITAGSKVWLPPKGLVKLPDGQFGEMIQEFHLNGQKHVLTKTSSGTIYCVPSAQINGVQSTLNTWPDNLCVGTTMPAKLTEQVDRIQQQNILPLLPDLGLVEQFNPNLTVPILPKLPITRLKRPEVTQNPSKLKVSLQQNQLNKQKRNLPYIMEQKKKMYRMKRTTKRVGLYGKKRNKRDLCVVKTFEDELYVSSDEGLCSDTDSCQDPEWNRKDEIQNKIQKKQKKKRLKKTRYKKEYRLKRCSVLLERINFGDTLAKQGKLAISVNPEKKGTPGDGSLSCNVLGKSTELPLHEDAVATGQDNHVEVLDWVDLSTMNESSEDLQWFSPDTMPGLPFDGENINVGTDDSNDTIIIDYPTIQRLEA